MKKAEILDVTNLFTDLARDLDASLTSETGQTLNIVEFIQQEVDLGIDLTRNQLLVLKVCYGCALDNEDIAILEYWKTIGKTTITEVTNPITMPQVLVLEAGRRCLTADTRINIPSNSFSIPYTPVSTQPNYLTFKDLAKKYYTGLSENIICVDIDLEIDRNGITTKATKLYRYQTTELITIVTADSHIEGTPEHKLWVANKGWVKLRDITKNDCLVSSSYKPLPILHTSYQLLPTPIYVYDLHVPDGNWYIANNYVSSNSGKSSLAALIAVYEFYYMSKLASPQKHFRIATSTPITILCLATTASQAKENIFRQIIQICRNSEYFMQLERRKELFIGKEEIALENKGLYIRSGNSKSASQVGGTLKCFILDEVSRFQDSEGKSNAMELWKNIGRSAAPFGAAAKLVGISSAWYEGDAIQRLYQSAETDRYAVGFRLVSWDLNTTINKENPIVAHDYADDPDLAALEYEGIRPAAVDAFLDAYQIRKAITGKSVLSVTNHVLSDGIINLVTLSINHCDRRPRYDSVLHLDPAIKGDSYALAIGHSEFDNDVQLVIIDAILVWKPTKYNEEVSITNVGEIIRTLHLHRPLVKVTADHYNSAETIQRLRQDGIPAEIVYFSNRTQLMMYSRVKSLLAENRLILPKDSPWSDLMYRELSQVQLINNRKIDHPLDNNGSKDVADAISAVAYELSERVLLDNSIVDSSLISPIITAQQQATYNTFNSEPNYTDSSTSKLKALGKLSSRRQWAQSELKNVKSNYINNTSVHLNNKYNIDGNY